MGPRNATAEPFWDETVLTPRERLETLCDPGSLEVIRSGVMSPHMAARARAGDGVTGGSGLVGGRPVFCYAQDAAYLGGSLGESHADTIVRILQLAARAPAPVVGFVESGGARLHEGIPALGGYGRVFNQMVALSGRVPQISIVTGLSAGGGAYSPALADWTMMTADSSMFLTGPDVVRDALGEDVEAVALGGVRVHQRNGVCHFVTPTVTEAAKRAREILGYLPAHAGARAPSAEARPPSSPDPAEPVPADPRGVYDVRSVLAGIVDGASFLEIARGWARNLVTGLARVEGRTVGIIANQPRYLGGVLDVDASQKGARFVSQCNAFGVPLVVLVDTPGFMPGTHQEAAGVIRHGAAFVHAFAHATVPRITVILRKAFGGAFITMNSKDLGADYVFAWPHAEIGVMGAASAVGIIHRRDLAEAPDRDSLRRTLAEGYAETHLGPDVAASHGFVDELIAPGATRQRIAHALRSLAR
jgi:acetyl-CoA carboxylase carboxyltransferase component